MLIELLRQQVKDLSQLLIYKFMVLDLFKDLYHRKIRKKGRHRKYK